MRKVVLATSVAALMLGSCYRSHLDPEHQPTNVLIVLDRSGSMSQRWDHRSKWVAANDALASAIEAEDKELRVGTLMFPTRSFAGSCLVDAPADGIALEPAELFVARWRGGPPGRPQGNTPMEAAFHAVDTTVERIHAEGTLKDERLLVLLLTDGEPNCGSDPDALRALASRWRGLGVEVYALGLPGSEEAAELLDDISTRTETVGGDRDDPATPDDGDGMEPRRREPEDPDELEDDVGTLI